MDAERDAAGATPCLCRAVVRVRAGGAGRVHRDPLAQDGRTDMTPRNKNRLMLIGVALLFLAPMIAAIVLNAKGWHPLSTSNNGTLVEPPQDLTGVDVALADGSKLAWSDPQRRWTLLALPGVQCAQACRTRLDEILRM